MRKVAHPVMPKVENGCHLHDNCFTCPFDDCRIMQNLADRKLKSKGLPSRKPGA